MTFQAIKTDADRKYKIGQKVYITAQLSSTSFPGIWAVLPFAGVVESILRTETLPIYQIGVHAEGGKRYVLAIPECALYADFPSAVRGAIRKTKNE